MTVKVPAWSALNEQAVVGLELPLLVKLMRRGEHDAVMPLPEGAVVVTLICPKKSCAVGCCVKVRVLPLVVP